MSTLHIYYADRTVSHCDHVVYVLLSQIVDCIKGCLNVTSGPATFIQYKIFGTIELGETGCIYRAINSQTNEMVILKQEAILKGNEGVPCSVSEKSPFERDGASEHCQVSIVNKERSVYLVMEYMDLNLRKYMMDTFPDIMMKLRIIKILEGLSYCHSNKILHQGLKHESLLLDHGNQSIVKIADFGTTRSIFVLILGKPCEATLAGVIALFPSSFFLSIVYLR
ncbi:Cyclin-dependent kinase A-1 [Camellia lanceoleosa]|uniref:Cyclin-dependent kinase A-1 n=1 Tax=Camellia lanceoleosa TaxID=1840588 RepID=A0ACC0J461_9ERIC|nr:Cyclin-dependent kinase A-1 [Camellia lanceoleosa]